MRFIGQVSDLCKRFTTHNFKKIILISEINIRDLWEILFFYDLNMSFSPDIVLGNLAFILLSL